MAPKGEIMLRKIVECIVKGLVENPVAVRVTQEHENKHIILSIHVDENDLGKVIGKGGKTIRSIRSVAITLNEEKDCQVMVDIAK